MNETNKEKQSDGSIMTVQASQPFSQSMRDGSEPDAMLLALLWSQTETLISRNRALLATGNYQGQKATIIILVGTEPTAEGFKLVGTANKDKAE